VVDYEWIFETRAAREMHGRSGGDEGLDDDLLREGFDKVGATIMGRNMFGPVRGEWTEPRWDGWWGDDPPFHHPVFVRIIRENRWRWPVARRSTS
jgi:dihydrofolate reductase